MSLILATAIWLLIRGHLISEGVWEEEQPPRARTLTPEEQRALEAGK